MPDSSPSSRPLPDWFQRMQAGDPAALNELLRVAGDRLERLARRMLRQFPNVRRLADTGDVCQEAVVRLLRSLLQLDRSPTNVRAFLALAAIHIRRELLDLARRCGSAKRRGDVPLESVRAECLPTVADEDADDLERWQHFHEEVEKLPAEEREVFGLRFYHNWSEEEIAALFGVTPRTVRRRWASGRARLAAALHGKLPEP